MEAQVKWRGMSCVCLASYDRKSSLNCMVLVRVRESYLKRDWKWSGEHHYRRLLQVDDDHLEIESFLWMFVEFWNNVLKW